MSILFWHFTDFLICCFVGLRRLSEPARSFRSFRDRLSSHKRTTSVYIYKYTALVHLLLEQADLWISRFRFVNLPVCFVPKTKHTAYPWSWPPLEEEWLISGSFLKWLWTATRIQSRCCLERSPFKSSSVVMDSVGIPECATRAWPPSESPGKDRDFSVVMSARRLKPCPLTKLEAKAESEVGQTLEPFSVLTTTDGAVSINVGHRGPKDDFSQLHTWNKTKNPRGY